MKASISHLSAQVRRHRRDHARFIVRRHLQHAVNQRHRRCLAIGAGHADDDQLARGKIVVGRRQIAGGFLGVGHLGIGHRQVGNVALTDDGRCASLDGTRDEVMAVYAQALARHKDATGLEFGIQFNHRRS